MFHHPTFARYAAAALLSLGMPVWLLSGAGCRKPDSEPGPASVSPAVQGTPIARSPAPGSNAMAAATPRAAAPPDRPAAEELDADGFLRLGFDKLSAFKYEVYEYYTEGVSGRPLLKSDDVIPEWVKQYDGRKVAVRGFVLPLRTRHGRVTEFLLLRDQGTCCFGPQAQINHFIRVNHPRGTEFEQTFPYRVRGVIRIGETYVQGYLTGIYLLDAESVVRSTE